MNLGRSSHKKTSWEECVSQRATVSPLLEDVTAFESDVRSKAHTFGASRSQHLVPLSAKLLHLIAGVSVKDLRSRVKPTITTKSWQTKTAGPCFCLIFMGHLRQWVLEMVSEMSAPFESKNSITGLSDVHEYLICHGNKQS